MAKYKINYTTLLLLALLVLMVMWFNLNCIILQKQIIAKLKYFFNN